MFLGDQWPRAQVLPQQVACDLAQGHLGEPTMEKTVCQSLENPIANRCGWNRWCPEPFAYRIPSASCNFPPWKVPVMLASHLGLVPCSSEVWLRSARSTNALIQYLTMHISRTFFDETGNFKPTSLKKNVLWNYQTRYGMPQVVHLKKLPSNIQLANQPAVWEVPKRIHDIDGLHVSCCPWKVSIASWDLGSRGSVQSCFAELKLWGHQVAANSLSNHRWLHLGIAVLIARHVAIAWPSCAPDLQWANRSTWSPSSSSPWWCSSAAYDDQPWRWAQKKTSRLQNLQAHQSILTNSKHNSIKKHERTHR